MSELRQDPISGRWVIIADNRAERPEEFPRAPRTRVAIDCPFCRGQEHQTTPAVAIYSDPHAPADAWEVRVVSNKYPALSDDAAQGCHGSPSAQGRQDSLFVARPGFGAHEVVIESPRHVESFAELTDSQAFWTFAAYRDRLRHYRDRGEFAAASVFKNVGPDAGASLTHAHSQILLLPQTPEFLTRELEGAAKYYDHHGKCVFCELARREIELGARMVAGTEHFVAVCPFAARFAYETWFLPRGHASHFEQTDNETLQDLALLVRRVIRVMEGMLDHPAYNFFLHTSPFDIGRQDHYHWHIELFPRVTKAAGFEWASGCHLNTVAPEQSALLLRGALEAASPPRLPPTIV